MASSIPGLRLVRCPRCRSVLTEIANVPVYQCGKCGATLRGDQKSNAVMALFGETPRNEISSCLAQFLDKRIYHVIQSLPQHQDSEVRNAKTQLMQLRELLRDYWRFIIKHLREKISNKLMEDWSWRFKGFFYMTEDVFDDLDIIVSPSDKRQGDDLSAFDEQMLIFMKAMEKLPEVTETITGLLRELTDRMDGMGEFEKIYSILEKQQVSWVRPALSNRVLGALKVQAVEKAKILEEFRPVQGRMEIASSEFPTSDSAGEFKRMEIASSEFPTSDSAGEFTSDSAGKFKRMEIASSEFPTSDSAGEFRPVQGRMETASSEFPTSSPRDFNLDPPSELMNLWSRRDVEMTKYLETNLIEFGPSWGRLEKQQVASSELPTLPYKVRELKGRTVEKAKILGALLLKAEEESKKSPVLIGITGPVGIGKTDLARSVYNSAQVEAEFDVRAWIYMGNDRQDSNWLTLQRSESASVDKPRQLRRFRGSSTVDIFRIIEKETDGKVLIVLDNFMENQEFPNQHFLSRWCRTRESRGIIVTTQCEGVVWADAVSLNVELDGLEEEEYLELFKECALGNRNRDKYPELENICGGIAKRFGGNPLAAVKIGRLLKSQPDKDHWRIISRSNLGLIDPTGSIIISELRHSYEKLPGYQKQCYLACALFPQNYPFEQNQLYGIWNAIGCSRTFDKYLFNQFFVSWARKDGEFILRAIFHELADYICDGEFFRLEDEIKEEDDIQIPDKTQHVYVTADNFVKVYRVLLEKTHLRSLVIHGDLSSEEHKTNFMGLLEEVLRNLKGLRLLIISVLPTGKLPDAIGGLKHLRYLELPIDTIMEESIQELPTWLSDNPFVGLRHLQNLKELREALLKKGSIQEHPTWKSSGPSASKLKDHSPSELSDTSHAPSESSDTSAT